MNISIKQSHIEKPLIDGPEVSPVKIVKLKVHESGTLTNARAVVVNQPAIKTTFPSPPLNHQKLPKATQLKMVTKIKRKVPGKIEEAYVRYPYCWLPNKY